MAYLSTRPLCLAGTFGTLSRNLLIGSSPFLVMFPILPNVYKSFE